MLKAGGFDEDFREASCEDIELGYRLYRAGLPMRYDPGALAYHLHRLDFDDLFDRQRKFAYWLAIFLKKHPQAKAYYASLPAENDYFSCPSTNACTFCSDMPPIAASEKPFEVVNLKPATYTCSFSFTLAKASRACSRSSRVCAAVTMVRTRDLSSGTVG